jgi:outer membrane protein assembly factor BamB
LKNKNLLTNKKPAKTLCYALILLLGASTLVTCVSTVEAAATYDTEVYITASPNPIGIGQKLSVVSIMPNVPPAQYPLDSPRYGYWENLTLKVWKPDGTMETLGPYRTAEAGTGYASYVPTMVGNYTFQWFFPGQTILVPPRTGDYYRPSTSDKFTVAVQTTQIYPAPLEPIPTGYWQAPIYGENKAWSTIAGNWLAGQNYAPNTDGYNPYTLSPNSSHILWEKQLMFGGIAAAEFGPDSSYSGRRPSEKLTPPIIMDGRLYYNEPTFVGTFGAATYNGFTCVDLFTGEVQWTTSPHEGQSINMGQVFYHYSTSQESVTQYLWGLGSNQWQMYDAWTGRWILNITGIPGGTNMFGPHGEILRYTINSNGTMTLWNSTKVLLTQIRAIGVAIDWTPVQGVYNYSQGIQWNAPITKVAGSTPSISVLATDLIIASNSFNVVDSQGTTQVIRQDVGIDISIPGQPRLMWAKNHTIFDTTDSIVSYSDGIYIWFARDKLIWYGVDAKTGNDLWQSQPMDTAFSMYSGRGDKTVIANGVIYNTGYDGMVRAINLKTGTLMWKWYTGSAGYDSPYGGWALQGAYTGPRFADGKVFVINGEHTPLASPWIGGKVYAIDGITGKEVWSISGTQAEAAPSAVAWGNFVYLNGYDGTLYDFGKGKSATTVSAPQVAVPIGTKVLLTGTVVDMSPAQPNTPAVSDESMTAWMQYLHMQKSMPTNAKGVQVKLTAIDPNGNWQDIGSTTSDIAGNYGIEWTPPVEGKYQIKATFEGTNSYGSSYDTTYMLIGPKTATPIASVSPQPTQTLITPTPAPTFAPTATPATTPSPAIVPPTGQGPASTYIAIGIAVIVIIAAAATLILKKRK